MASEEPLVRHQVDENKQSRDASHARAMSLGQDIKPEASTELVQLLKDTNLSPPTSLAGLPNEILLDIFKKQEKFKEMTSLSRTCQALHHLHRENEDKIHNSILSNSKYHEVLIKLFEVEKDSGLPVFDQGFSVELPTFYSDAAKFAWHMEQYQREAERIFLEYVDAYHKRHGETSTGHIAAVREGDEELQKIMIFGESRHGFIESSFKYWILWRQLSRNPDSTTLLEGINVLDVIRFRELLEYHPTKESYSTQLRDLFFVMTYQKVIDCAKADPTAQLWTDRVALRASRERNIFSVYWTMLRGLPHPPMIADLPGVAKLKRRIERGNKSVNDVSLPVSISLDGMLR